MATDRSDRRECAAFDPDKILGGSKIYIANLTMYIPRGSEGGKVLGALRNNMNNRQIDIKQTKQIRIDKELHQVAKLEAVKKRETLKTFTERALELLIEQEKLPN